MADGTWDSSTSHTNVYKIYKAITRNGEQIPLYDDGVGADTNPIEHLVGGAFGAGLWGKIKDGYKQISHVYESGDSVYLVGFSRGAYTARSLAGMIAACGLPTKDFTDDMVETVFSAYRDKDNRQKYLDKLKDCNLEQATIQMVGVWDTVGSLGIPAAIGGIDPLAFGFLDTSLHPDVRHAYHALAIDEKRAQFPATLWKGDPAPGQVLEQVWFCGAHSDVGGGEPIAQPGATALSDITLAWMITKAMACGVTFDATALKQYTIPLDPALAMDTLHSSWTVINGFPRVRPIAANSTVANSVAIRCQHDNAYHPSNLAFENGLLASTYGSDGVVSLPELAKAAGQGD
ncbi:MAG TPA: DUF2235 domain-containing protein [Bryobacteraceae bacterium]|nr:DUF2235 domain-containing protein [Bryobacteraceae bacterium]